MSTLPRTFYDRDARTVAIDLLGRRLVRAADPATSGDRVSGVIVETEAYMGSIDLACHGSRGQSPRNATMFGPPGHAYVYLIYGVYHCMNAVVGPVGDPSAVLIRAVEIETMPSGTRPYPGTGPGRVARTFALTRSHDAADLCSPDSPVVIESGTRPIDRTYPETDVRHGPRIGMGATAEVWANAPLRFWIDGHPAVSGTRRAAREGAIVGR